MEQAANLPAGVEVVQITSIGADTNWSDALAGVDTVVHLAARVTVMNDTEAYPLAAFRQVNVAGTERLARMAAINGVKRFVYVSSVKLNGEGCEKSFTEHRQFKDTTRAWMEAALHNGARAKGNGGVV